MHIVDSTLFFAPHSGGVKRYLMAKRRHFAPVPGLRHTLLVPGPPGNASPPGIVQVTAPRIPFGGGYRLPLRMAAWRETLCRLEPDLIEVADPYHLAWAALAAADARDVPTVAFAHSDLSRLIASRCGSLAAAAADAYLRRLYARFDVVLAPSRLVAEHLRSIGVDRVETQPLGVDAETFHPATRDPDLRSQLNLPADTRLLIFAGRMAREKSIPLICRAVEQLGAPYHLILVGGRERRRRSDHVTELPYQQDARALARLLASADALLHGGAQETFGLVVLEAMACGLPVVGVAAGAVAELVNPEVGVLAEPGSVESLQHAIRWLFECDHRLVGACARACVERCYTWQRTFTSQLARYSHLIQVHGIESDLAADRISP